MRTTLTAIVVMLSLAVTGPSWGQADYSQMHTVLKPVGSAPAHIRTVEFASGDDGVLSADIYFDPKVREPRPAIVFVSGTEDARGWRGYQDLAQLAVERGFVAIIPEKRFARGGAGIANGRDDTLAVLRAELAADLIDRSRLCVWTFSGGGSTMSAIYGSDALPVSCAVGFYPILSLRQFASDNPVWLARYSPADVAAASGSPTSPPALIFRAGLDSGQINSSIDLFASVASLRNMPVEIANLPGAHHAFDLVDDSDWSRRAIEQAFAFSRRHTRGDRPLRPVAELTQELVGLERERQAAYVAGDRLVLERHFASEYIHTNLRGGATDRAAELAFYAPGTFSLSSGELSEVVVRDYGATAVLLGVVDWRGASYRPPNGPVIDLSGRFRVTRTYVWRDGRWQLAASHASKIG